MTGFVVQGHIFSFLIMLNFFHVWEVLMLKVVEIQ